MNIITGYRGEPHVTSQQERDIYKAVFGEDTAILDVEGKLAATVISANEIEIEDGVICAEGCMGAIARGSTDSLAISNGAQGMRRTDLIVARYTRNAGTGVESMTLAVITGTPAASEPATPAYTHGEIADGDTLVEFPIYKVNINGISIESVERLVSIVGVPAITDNLSTRISALATNLTDLVKIISVNLTYTAAAAGVVSISNYDVSADVPTGYTLKGVYCTASGSDGFYCTECDLVDNEINKIKARFYRAAGSSAGLSPWVRLICVKELTT